MIVLLRLVIVCEKCLDIITRALFYLDVYFPDIFSYGTYGNEQHAAQEPKRKHQRRPAFYGTPDEKRNKRINRHDKSDKKYEKTHGGDEPYRSGGE